VPLLKMLSIIKLHLMKPKIKPIFLFKNSKSIDLMSFHLKNTEKILSKNKSKIHKNPMI
jgi:hypothetical protein